MSEMVERLIRSVKELLGLPTRPWDKWGVKVFWAYWGREPAFAVSRHGLWWTDGKYQGEFVTERHGFWRRRRIVLFRTYAEAQAKADEMNLDYVELPVPEEHVPF